MSHLRRWPLSCAVAAAACLAFILGSAEAQVETSLSPQAATIASNGSIPDTVPHFATGTYNLLRSSGDRVSHAVEGVLGVQGSLDDLKEDLSVEYRRWKAKQNKHIVERQRLEHEIQGHQAKLLEQKSQRAEAARLRGDLALAMHVHVDLNNTHERIRATWYKRQEGLRQEIEILLAQINYTHEVRHDTMAAVQNKTDEIRALQSVLGEYIVKANNTLAEYAEALAKHTIASSREQAELSEEVGEFQQVKANISSTLQGQGQLQWLHDHLAAQALEVAKQREVLEQDRLDCDAKIHEINDRIAVTSQMIQDDIVKMRQCQLGEAENAVLQEKVNKCRAATAADRAVN